MPRQKYCSQHGSFDNDYYRCPDCEEAIESAREKHEPSNEQNAEIAKVRQYPILTGTSRQIAWAETIRIEMANAGGRKFDDAIKTLDFLTSAVWWIDHRQSSLEAEIGELVVDQSECQQGTRLADTVAGEPFVETPATKPMITSAVLDQIEARL